MIALKDGSTVEDPRLDRIVHFDSRSREFKIRTLLDEKATLLGYRLHRRTKPAPTLDQGAEGACVGFSCSHAVGGKPFAKAVDNLWARTLYFEAQQRDYWEGGEYPGASPVYSGSSVLGGMKALHDRGLIDGYRWVGAGSQTPVDDSIDALRYVGQVVFGTYWYPSMFDTRPDGILEVDTTMQPSGGHAWCAVDALNLRLPGTDRRKMYVVIQNSWGEGWGVQRKGQGGFAYMLPEDLEKLLANDGEGAVPLKG